MRRWIIAAAVGLLVLCEMLLNVPGALAGAFDQLSPGNQKAARSLFEAQRSTLPPGTRPLTLDEIAARKQSGQGWGRIFDGMKSAGLVDAKNFGQTVSSFNHRHHLSTEGTATTAANRTVGVRPDSARGGSAHAASSSDGGQHGSSNGNGATHHGPPASAAMSTHAQGMHGGGQGRAR